MPNSKKVEELRDYLRVSELADALWGKGKTHGAAVMVGAGFSRFAKKIPPTTPDPPLWADLAKAMQEKLYPNRNQHSINSPPSLADEFQATFGKLKLEHLIRTMVVDTAWNPSDTHKNLLSLPWTDILTTNWDTLLERTALSLPLCRFQDVVYVPTDLARARGNRIIKLHGSLPSNTPFIISAEDFRRYPMQFAPFVNVARQILIENELCLLGFSGDDPNFLEWSGWIRDRFGKLAHPIRLVGVLDLPEPKRRALEDRNITPIDLAELVPDLPRCVRYERAMNIFLRYLLHAKPTVKSEWSISMNHDQVWQEVNQTRQVNIKTLLQVWKHDREAYPGWILAPYSQRKAIKSTIIHPEQIVDFSKLDSTLRAKFLYEFVWRNSTALQPLSEEIAKQIKDLVESDGDVSLSTAKKIALRASIVQASRYEQDWKEFDERITLLEKVGVREAQVEACYQRCLKALSNFDYGFIADHEEEIKGNDPIWKLRRSRLLAEIGDTEKAETLLEEAYESVRVLRNRDRTSAWLLSRDLWASWILKRVRKDLDAEHADWHLISGSNEIGPKEEISELDQRMVNYIVQHRDSRFDRQPAFEPGYRRSKQSINFDLMSRFPLYIELNLISELVGIPPKIGRIDILASRLIKAMPPDTNYTFYPGEICDLLRVGEFADKDWLEIQLSRVAIAIIPDDIVSDLSMKIRRGIDFIVAQVGSKRIAYSAMKEFGLIDRLTYLIESLSRLSVRECVDSFEIFKYGIKLSCEPVLRRTSMLDCLSNLLHRSIQAMHPDMHSKICLNLLQLPVVSEEENDDRRISQRWNKVFDAMKRRSWKSCEKNDIWRNRIEELISAAANNSGLGDRADAIYRLFLLFRCDALTSAESRNFVKAVWKECEMGEFPRDTDLSVNNFLLIPFPDLRSARKLFDNEVVSNLSSGNFQVDNVMALIRASLEYLTGKHRPYKIDKHKAYSIIDEVLTKNGRVVRRPVLFFFDPEKDYDLELIDQLLGITVLPSVSWSDLDPKIAKELLQFLADGSYPWTTLSLLRLVDQHGLEFKEVLGTILGKLLPMSCSCSKTLRALQWFTKQGYIDEKILTSQYLGELVSILPSSRDSLTINILRLLSEVIRAQGLKSLDTDRLVLALGGFRRILAYRPDLERLQLPDLGLLRTEVVKISALLLEHGYSDKSSVLEDWRKEINSDPLPEVRYALVE